MQACVCALPLGQAVSMLTASDTSEAADSESTAATADSPSAAATADSSSEEKTSAAASEVIGSAGHGHSRTCCFDWCIHTRPVIHSSLCSQGIVEEDQCVQAIRKTLKGRIRHDQAVQSGPQIRRHRHRVGLRRTEGWRLALHECVTCMACKFLIFMSMMTWCFTVM